MNTKQSPLAIKSENTRLQVYSFQKFLLPKPAIIFSVVVIFKLLLRTFFYFDLDLNYICTLCATFIGIDKI